MPENDSLRDFKFVKKGGKYATFEDGKAIKLRVLTTDPMVYADQWGNTRFAFVIYNFTEEKAQILNKGVSIAKQIQKLHQDEDLGANIKKIDIKITAEGSGIDTEYTVTALPTAQTLTNEQIKEAQTINLDEEFENGQRMSFYKPGEAIYESPRAVAANEGEERYRFEDKIIEDEEPIDVDDIQL